MDIDKIIWKIISKKKVRCNKAMSWWSLLYMWRDSK